MRLLLALTLTAALAAGACGDGDQQSSSSSTAKAANAPGGLTVGGLDPPDDEGPAGPITEQPFVDLDGNDGTFARFAGKPLVVNFWASWCVPCVKEMPDFEAVYQEQGGQIGFVGVNVIDQVADARTMAERTGVTYPLVRDRSGALLRFVGGATMPTTALVDAEGNVVKVLNKALSAEELRTEMKVLG